jgi:hypothetical protein
MQDVVKHTFGLLSDIPVGNKVLTKLEDPAVVENVSLALSPLSFLGSHCRTRNHFELPYTQ